MRAAIRAHACQTEPLAALVGVATYFGWWRDECFRAPTPAERSLDAVPMRRSEVVS